MLCGYPHLLAVASLLIFWRCPRPCLLASMLALPTFALTLAKRLSDRQNGRGKLLTRSRAPRSWQSLTHRTGPTPNRMSKPVTNANFRQPAHRFANDCCPFARAGALPVLRQRAKHQPLTSNRAAKSWQCLAHRASPMKNRLSNANHDGCPLARAGALLVLHRCARHQILISNRDPKSWQSLAHRRGSTHKRLSTRMTSANLRQPANRFANVCCAFARAGDLLVLHRCAKHQPLTSNCASKSWQCLLIRSRAWGSWQSLAHRARRGLELVQLPSCGDDRQSLLAMCVDVESFRYEAQSAAASAVGLGACASDFKPGKALDQDKATGMPNVQEPKIC